MTTSRRVIGALSALAVAVTTMVAAAAGAQAVGPGPAAAHRHQLERPRRGGLPLRARHQPEHRPARLRQRGRHVHRLAGGVEPAVTRARRVHRRPRQRRQHDHPVAARPLRPGVLLARREAEVLPHARTGSSSRRRGPRGDPNHNILFDWSEFTYNDAGLWLNSSQVDMFAVPHAVTVTGAHGAPSATGDLVANGRDSTSSTRSGPVRLGEHRRTPAPTARCCACSPPARRRARA